MLASRMIANYSSSQLQPPVFVLLFHGPAELHVFCFPSTVVVTCLQLLVWRSSPIGSYVDVVEQHNVHKTKLKTCGTIKHV